MTRFNEIKRVLNRYKFEYNKKCNTDDGKYITLSRFNCTREEYEEMFEALLVWDLKYKHIVEPIEFIFGTNLFLHKTLLDVKTAEDLKLLNSLYAVIFSILCDWGDNNDNMDDISVLERIELIWDLRHVTNMAKLKIFIRKNSKAISKNAKRFVANGDSTVRDMSRHILVDEELQRLVDKAEMTGLLDAEIWDDRVVPLFRKYKTVKAKKVLVCKLALVGTLWEMLNCNHIDSETFNSKAKAVLSRKIIEFR